MPPAQVRGRRWRSAPRQEPDCADPVGASHPVDQPIRSLDRAPCGPTGVWFDWSMVRLEYGVTGVCLTGVVDRFELASPPRAEAPEAFCLTDVRAQAHTLPTDPRRDRP